MLTPVVDGAYWWQALEVKLKRHLNGYLFLTRVGPILVDPPPAAKVILQQIEGFGRPKAVIITGRHQVRRAQQFRDWYGAKIFAPYADRAQIPVQANAYYRDGETLPGGFVAVGLEHQRSPGESALFHPRSRLLVASHLSCEVAGYVQMRPESFYRNFSRAFEGQLRLLELDFDVLLPGRGEPIASEGKLALAKFMAGYTAPV